MSYEYYDSTSKRWQKVRTTDTTTIIYSDDIIERYSTQNSSPEAFWLILWELLRDDQTRGGFMSLAYAPTSAHEEKLINQAFSDIQTQLKGDPKL